MSWLDPPAQEPARFRVEELERSVIGRRMALGRWSRGTLRVDESYNDQLRDVLLSVEAEVLRQVLPPVQVSETAVMEVFRPATWVDHFKLAYAGRWWMRWWVRRWKPHLVVVPHRLTVVVDLQQWRQFPMANHDPADYGGRLGAPHIRTEMRQRAHFE